MLLLPHATPAVPITHTCLVNLRLGKILTTMTFHSGLAKVFARTKADLNMGNVKQFMHGLRSRLQLSKPKASGSSTSDRMAATSPLTNERCESSSTPSTLPLSTIHHTPATASSNLERTIYLNEDGEERHSTEESNVDDENIPHRHPASTPLPTSSSDTARGRSLRHEQQMVTTELRQSRSHTLSLSSRSSTSTWSFACSSARRIEHEHEESFNGSEPSFGSLSGWGFTAAENEDRVEPSEGPAQAETQDAFPNMPSSGPSSEQDSDEFDVLPDWADVEDDPDYNVLLVRVSDMWSITSIASSDAAQVRDALVMPGTAMDDMEDKQRGQEGGGEASPSKRCKLEEEMKLEQKC
jgi:hypothetical protein